MGVTKISENVYSVGVLNPSLRIFDVIMKTEYGTSYNAYLIKNNGKCALVETVHEKFFGEYLENIRSVLGDTAPDCLIMNHNEPDHSGSVAKLTDIYPGMIVIESKAGAMYIKNIANKELNIKTVSDNEVIDLGGDGLRFIVAPFLHWPDSMFTYFAKDKILFTCDFLGAHFCEPTVFDYNVKYPIEYNQSFREYYNAIFAPFKPYVLSGLDKIKDIDFEIACPSHGPILTKKDGGSLDDDIKRYATYSAPQKNEIFAKARIPIFYCSAYGNTEKLAGYIKTGIQEIKPDTEVSIFDINFFPGGSGQIAETINSCDAFLLGSPTINRDAVAPVWELINAIDAISMRDRPCAVFGSYGWSGEACGNLISRLKGLK